MSYGQEDIDGGGWNEVGHPFTTSAASASAGFTSGVAARPSYGGSGEMYDSGSGGGHDGEYYSKPTGINGSSAAAAAPPSTDRYRSSQFGGGGGGGSDEYGSEIFHRGGELSRSSTEVYSGGSGGGGPKTGLSRATTDRYESGGLDRFLSHATGPASGVARAPVDSQSYQSGSSGQQQRGGLGSPTGLGGMYGGSDGGSGSLEPYPSLRPDQQGQSQQLSSSSHHQPTHAAAAAAVAPAASSQLPGRLVRRNMMNQRPDLTESAPMPPIADVVEANLPRPKVTRRYQRYTKLPREPDLARAKVVKNARVNKHGNDEGQHVLTCPNCRHFLKIPKSAVLMHCPTCSTVSPASSSNNQ